MLEYPILSLLLKMKYFHVEFYVIYLYFQVTACHAQNVNTFDIQQLCIQFDKCLCDHGKLRLGVAKGKGAQNE